MLRDERYKAALTKVLSHPLEDKPRLEYASLMDELDGPRSEFIRLQVEYFRTGDQSSETASAKWRKAEWLRREHHEEWESAMREMVDYYHFSRGFVELVGLSADTFLRKAEVLFTMAPVLHLELKGPLLDPDELFASAYLRTIRSLSLTACDLNDSHMALIAETENLREVRWLSLAHNEIGLQGIETLAGSTKLPKLQYVNLYGNLFDIEPGWAHEDNRIVDSWLSPNVNKLSSEARQARWLDDRTLRAPSAPDIFHMADQD